MQFVRSLSQWNLSQWKRRPCKSKNSARPDIAKQEAASRQGLGYRTLDRRLWHPCASGDRRERLPESAEFNATTNNDTPPVLTVTARWENPSATRVHSRHCSFQT